MKKQLTAQEALDKLRGQCSVAEVSSHECREKLSKWGIDELTSRKIIALLKRDSYVDDRRYLRAYVSDAVRFRKWGRYKIGSMLRAKGFTGETIKDAIGEIDEEEYYEAMRSFVKGKISILGGIPLERNDRDKLLRSAMSRGYEPGPIIEILNEMKRDDGVD